MNPLPPGTNVVALPSWLIGIAGSYLLSAELGCACTIGYLAQWTLSAPAKVRDWVAPAVIVAACALMYLFALGHMPAHFPPTREWWAGFITWAMTANGVASASGRTGGAAKTNTL